MTNRRVCGLLTFLPFSFACGDAPPVPPDASPAKAAAVQPNPDVALALAMPSDGPAGLWTRYKLIHATATRETALDVGRRLDNLLSEDARALATNALSDSMRSTKLVPANAAVGIDTLRHRLLGESALARKDHIARYKLAPVEVTGNRAILHVYDGSKLAMSFPVVVERGEWRFLPSSKLLATYAELYPLDEEDMNPATRRTRTAHAAAYALAAAYNEGTARDVYDLLDSTTKARMRAVVPGTTDEDVVRAFGKVLRSSREQSGRARVVGVKVTSADRALATFSYDSGFVETLTAVNEIDGWRLQTPF